MLGDAAAAGDAITIWCNNRACGCWREHGRQYRRPLARRSRDMPSDMASTAYVDLRAQLTCRYRGSGDLSTIVDSH